MSGAARRVSSLMRVGVSALRSSQSGRISCGAGGNSGVVGLGVRSVQCADVPLRMSGAGSTVHVRTLAVRRSGASGLGDPGARLAKRLGELGREVSADVTALQRVEKLWNGAFVYVIDTGGAALVVTDFFFAGAVESGMPLDVFHYNARMNAYANAVAHDATFMRNVEDCLDEMADVGIEMDDVTETTLAKARRNGGVEESA